MHANRVIEAIGIWLLTLAALFLCGAPALADDAMHIARDDGARFPNIVFIICDDLRYDTFGFMHYPHVHTPNIDRLATEGVTFTNAFVNIAICGPSRSSFWTGRYPGSKRGNRQRSQDFLKLLAKSGYQTREIGKMHGTGGKPCFVTYNGEKRHQSEVNHLETEVFLRERDAERPFCLRLGYVCTHAPFQPHPDTRELYRDARFDNPVTRTPEYFQSLPPILRTNLNVTRYAKVFPPERGDAPFQAFVQNYLRCVTTIDRSVGKVLSLLDRFDVYDNTIVIFTSDHGFFLGEHGYGGKWTAHEPSICIPLMIRDPRLSQKRRGTRVEAMALNVDLCPTVLAAAGLAIPSDLHGRSLQPLLEGETPAEWRKDFYYRFRWGSAAIPNCEAVRTERYKYVAYWPGGSSTDTNPEVEQLFDLEEDPDESRNLYAEAAQGEVLQKLKRRCTELRDHYYPR